MSNNGMTAVLTPTLPTDLTDRLVTLCDGRTGLRGGIQVDVCEASSASNSPTDSLTHLPAPCLDFVASDETLDRYNEVIMARGWRLEQYRRNPVFQNAHQYGDVIF